MISITKIGDVYEVLAIIAIFGLFLLLKNKDYFYSFVITSGLGVTLSWIIKWLVQRARPVNSLMEYDYSFPSSHATIAAIFLLSSIFLLIPLMKKGFSKNIFATIVCIIFPLVAFSRIYLSVHWTSDVIAGILLGAICFIFSKTICCHKKENVL
jgi:undecaprenyl-diphosphatase